MKKLLLFSLLLVFCFITISPVSAIYYQEQIEGGINWLYPQKAIEDTVNHDIWFSATGGSNNYVYYRNFTTKTWNVSVFTSISSFSDLILDNNRVIHLFGEYSGGSPNMWRHAYSSDFGATWSYEESPENYMRGNSGGAVYYDGTFYSAGGAWSGWDNNHNYTVGTTGAWSYPAIMWTTAAPSPLDIKKFSVDSQIHGCAYDSNTKDLIHFYYNGSAWIKETVVSASMAGAGCSIYEITGKPYIQYYDETSASSRLIYKSGTWIGEDSWQLSGGRIYTHSIIKDGANFYGMQYYAATKKCYYQEGNFNSWNIVNTEIPCGDGGLAYLKTSFGNVVFYQNNSLSDRLFWAKDYDENETCISYTPTLNIIPEKTTLNVSEEIDITFTGTINPTRITWGFTNQESYYYPKTIEVFQKTGNNWYQWNDNSNDYDIAVTEAEVFTRTKYWNMTSGTYEQYDSNGHQIYLRVEDEICDYTIDDIIDLTVNGADTTRTIDVFFINSLTGGYLNNVNVSIWEKQPRNLWYNYTNIDTPMQVGVYKNGLYSFVTNKSGYTGTTNNFVITDGLTRINLYLYPTCNAPSGYACLNIQTYWYSSSGHIAIQNAKVMVNNQTQYTNAQGNTMFFVPENSNYYYTINHTQFEDASGIVTVTTGEIVESIDLIPKSMITPTPTIPTVTTPPITTISPDDRRSKGLIWTFKHWISNAGGSTEEEAGWLIALGIIVILMLIGGGVGGGIGVLFGAAAGFVASLALQLVPYWTFFALIGLGFMGFIIFRRGE